MRTRRRRLSQRKWRLRNLIRYISKVCGVIISTAEFTESSVRRSLHRRVIFGEHYREKKCGVPNPNPNPATFGNNNSFTLCWWFDRYRPLNVRLCHDVDNMDSIRHTTSYIPHDTICITSSLSAELSTLFITPKMTFIL